MQQPMPIRGLVVAILHIERGYSYQQIARYYGIALATAWRYAYDCLDYDWLSEDVEIARSVIAACDSPLYATHW
jgi:hypothetical protein